MGRVKTSVNMQIIRYTEMTYLGRRPNFFCQSVRNAPKGNKLEGNKQGILYRVKYFLVNTNFDSAKREKEAVTSTIHVRQNGTIERSCQISRQRYQNKNKHYKTSTFLTLSESQHRQKLSARPKNIVYIKIQFPVTLF